MDDLVDQVATAILSETPANYVTQSIAQAYRNAEIALAIIEPVIRADERAQLRAEVEAIPSWEDREGWLVLSYKDVLAVLSGGSDD